MVFFFDVRALIVQNLVIVLLSNVVNGVNFHLLEYGLMGPILSIAKLKHKLTSWVTSFSHMAIYFVYYCYGLKFCAVTVGLSPIVTGEVSMLLNTVHNFYEWVCKRRHGKNE
jgi:hypothetical protein